MRASHAHLTGQPVETTLEEVLEAMLSEDQAALDRAVADFEATTLLGIPPSVEWNDRMPMSTQPTCELPVAGTTHKVRGVPGDESFLAVDVDGVSIGSPGAHAVALYTDLAGVLTYPDGARTLIKRDGWYLHIEPTLWTNGRKAVDAIDAAVSPALLLPMPERPPEEVPTPPPLRRAVWHVARRLLVPVIIAAALILAVWLVVQSGEVKVQHIAGPLFGGLVGAIVVQRRNNRS